MKKKKDLLTERQRDVLSLAAHGKSNKAIADILFISDSTVKAHLSEIFKKFGVTNRTQAAIIARDKGLIPPQDLKQP